MPTIPANDIDRQPTPAGDRLASATCSLSAEHLGRPEFRLYECADKAEVQAVVADLTGNLPSDLEDAGWADGDTLYMVIRHGCGYARIAHEAVHAAVLWGASKGIDAADMTLHRLPGNDDYGWIPGEIIAELVEQIVLFVIHGRFCKANSKLSQPKSPHNQ